MAAVQGLLKKHDAFETDLSVHNDKVNEINAAGQKLIEARNHHSSNIVQRCDLLRNKMHNLGELAMARKQNLLDNSAYLQFMWKADVVESWIAEKETYVRSNDFGRDLSSVQTLLTKQETFDIGKRLRVREKEMKYLSINQNIFDTWNNKQPQLYGLIPKTSYLTLIISADKSRQYFSHINFTEFLKSFFVCYDFDEPIRSTLLAIERF